MKCKNYDNISFSCGQGNVDSEISGRIILYRLEDVERIVAKDGKRGDESNIIEEIVSANPPFFVEGVDGSYSQRYAEKTLNCNLDLYVNNTDEETEDKLDAIGKDRFVVLFRLVGEKIYRVVGLGEGCSVEVETSISGRENHHHITVNYQGKHEINFISESFFEVSDLEFDPIWKPLYEFKVCVLDKETDGQNGYYVPTFVVKVNANGEPLDENDQLCAYSGRKQSAYRYIYQSKSDEYEEVGTFDENTLFNGKPIKIYDPAVCAVDDPTGNTITVTPTRIIFDTQTRENTVEINSTGSWEYREPKYFATPDRGGKGATTVTVTNPQTNEGGAVDFRNRATNRTATLDVECYYLRHFLQSYTVVGASQSKSFAEVIGADINGLDIETSDDRIVVETSGDEIRFNLDGVPRGTYNVNISITAHPTEAVSFNIVKM